jgi:hypothetical protein
MEEIDEMSISGNTIVTEIPMPSPLAEEIYVESDDINPSHINYDIAEKNLIPHIENEDDIVEHNHIFTPKKKFLRDVRNSKRRKS